MMVRSNRIFVPLLTLPAVAGCLTLRPAVVPPEARAALRRARQALRSGSRDAAARELDRALAIAPRFLEAHLLSGSLMSPGARRRRALELAGRHGSEGWALVVVALHGRSGAERLAALRAALRLDPALFEARLALGRDALAAGRLEEAALHAAAALSLGPDRAESHRLAGELAFRRLRYGRAMKHFRRAAALDRRDTRSLVYLALDQLVRKKFRASLQLFDRVLAIDPRFPFAPDDRRIFRVAAGRLLERLRFWRKRQEGLEVARKTLARFGDADAHDYFGHFSERLGFAGPAEVHYRKALALDPYHLRAATDLRQLLFRRGRYDEAVRVWERTVPMAMLLRPDNLLSPRWRRLLAAVRRLRSVPRDRAALVELARSSARCSWLTESRAAYDRLLVARFDPGLAAERQRVADLERAVRRLRVHFRRLYRAMEKGGSSADLDEANRVLDRILGPVLGSAVERDLKRYFLVVREADPFLSRPGGLLAALSDWGMAADYGDNNGHAELRLMRLLAVRKVNERVRGRQVSYEALVTDDTLIPSYSEFRAGSERLSGRTYLSGLGFYVSIDSLRPSRPFLDDLIAFARAGLPGLASRRGPWGGRYDPRLAWRLTGRTLAGLGFQSTPGTKIDRDRLFRDLLTAFADNVWYHELGHIHDFERHVPLLPNLHHNLWMIFSHAFSRAAIHSRFERVAETFALSATSHPHLLLLDNLRRLDVDPHSFLFQVLLAWTKEDPRDSPYYKAALRILDDLSEASGTPAGRAFAPLDRLGPERVRALALRLLVDYGAG